MLTRLRQLALAVVVMLLLASAPQRASAQSAADVQNARALFREALDLSKQDKWDEAIVVYERSLALKEAPITLYSLGVAYKKVGRNADALESLRQFLAKPKTKTTQRFENAAKAAVAELEPMVAHVTITVEPSDIADLSVVVDDTEMPIAGVGLPRLLDPGGHTITARAPGHHDAASEIEIAAGESAEITLTLEPKPPEEPSADEPDGTVEAAPFPIVPVTLMAVGVAGVAVGLTMGLLGVSEADDAPTRDGEEADAARSKMLVGDVVASVGGAIGVAGVVWLLVELLDEPGDGDAGWISPHGSGVRLSF